MANIHILNGVEADLDVTPPHWMPGDVEGWKRLLGALVASSPVVMGVAMFVEKVTVRIVVPVHGDLQKLRDDIYMTAAMAWIDFHGWDRYVINGGREVMVFTDDIGQPRMKDSAESRSV